MTWGLNSAVDGPFVGVNRLFESRITIDITVEKVGGGLERPPRFSAPCLFSFSAPSEDSLKEKSVGGLFCH